MSQNKKNELLFDRWLTENLQSSPCANPAFAQNLTRKMLRLHAGSVLRRTLLQKRLAALAFIILLGVIIGLLCCPPVLRFVYTMLEIVFTKLLTALLQPQPAYLLIPAVALLALFFLFRALWRTLNVDI